MRIYATRALPAAVRAALECNFELTFHDSDRPVARGELLACAAGADGLVTTPADRVDNELFDAAGPQLRVVANYVVGYDNVDVEAATRREIVVANTPGVLNETTAELTIALMLALLRRVAEGDRLIRRREPWAWGPNVLLGSALAGRTLGIVGFGRIGREVARLARAFGMRIVHTGPDRRLSPVLSHSDVVSVHVPLTPETQHLIDAEALALMKPTAVLVNTSRGPIVDEAALVEALRERRIAGAALDVHEREPEVTAELLAFENVVLTPHLGSATLETREAMGMLVFEALRSVLIEERCPENALNPEAWPTTRDAPRS